MAAVRTITTRPTAVLHVIDTLDLGGAEMHCLRLSSALDRSRFEIHVAYGGAGALEPLAARTGLRCFRFRDRLASFASLATLSSALRLYRYIRKHDIRIVHTYLYGGHVIASLAAKAAGVPVVEHVHDYRYENRTVARTKWHVHTRHYRLVRLFHRLAARTIVLTPENLSALHRLRAGGDGKCRLIVNGVPAPSQSADPAVPAALGIAPHRALLLVACSLAPHKDVGLAIRAFAKAAGEIDGLELLIAGDGPQRASLIELAAALGVARRVHFVGAVADIHALLPHCTALLHTSHIELNSLAILEAMRCGVPVIARATVGGNRLLVADGRTGRLLDSSNDADWARAIVELASDPELRLRLGEAARREAEARFDLNAHAREVESIYDSLSSAQAA